MVTDRLVDWFNTLPTAVLLLCALFGVGWIVLRAAGMRGLRPVALAPTISALILTVDGLIQAAVHGTWGWVSVMTTTSITAAAAYCAKRVIDRWDPGILMMPAQEREGMTTRTDGGRAERRLFLTVLATWVITAGSVVLTIPPGAVSQSGDALYHYMQVALIEREDYASMLAPNAGMFGLTRHSGFYPIVWHQVASLGAWSWRETLTANNVLLLAVALVWYLGLVYLARTALPDIRHAPYLALAVSLLVPVFPWRITYGAALWPYCMAVSACPAVSALAIECWRRARTLVTVTAREPGASRRDALLRAATALGAITPFFIGACLIHTSAAAILLWPLIGIAWCWTVLRAMRARRLHQAQAARAWWVIAAAALILAVAFVYLPGPQQQHFGRSAALDWSHLTTKLLIPLTLTYFGDWISRWTEVPLAVLSVLGAVVSLRRRRHWELIVGWAFCLPLILAATAPVPVISRITGLFYRNPHRIKAMTAALAVLVIVLALDFLRARLAPVVNRVRTGIGEALEKAGLPAAGAGTAARSITNDGVALLCIAALAGALFVEGRAIASDVRYGYLPARGDTRFIVDDQELAMIRRLPDELPDDAIVLGDAVAGAGYVPILTGLRSVWVFPGEAPDDEDGIYLREHFNEIHDDPRVCQILRRHKIDYYYADVTTYFNGVWLDKLRPGLYRVDTSRGFTLIDRGGSASVWRIDACR